jgi:hypothetical protein
MQSEDPQNRPEKNLELETQQHLHAEDQEPGFVQRGFDFAVQLLRHAPARL